MFTIEMATHNIMLESILFFIKSSYCTFLTEQFLYLFNHIILFIEHLVLTTFCEYSQYINVIFYRLS